MPEQGSNFYNDENKMDERDRNERKLMYRKTSILKKIKQRQKELGNKNHFVKWTLKHTIKLKAL